MSKWFVVHLVHTAVCTGTTLGREGDLEAVKQLGLPSCTMVMDNPATELNGEVTRKVVTTRNREVDPEGL